jgi:hypothetical protein
VTKKLSGVVFWSLLRDIAQRDDANAVTALINHRQPFNLSLLEELATLGDVCIWRHGYRRGGHNIHR